VKASLNFFGALALLGLGAISLMPLLWRFAPQTVALVPAAPQFAVAAAILTLLFLALRTWKAAAAALALALWNVLQFWPALGDLAPGAPAQAEGAPAQAAAAPPLKVIALNLWYRNAEPEKTSAYLAASGADVIGLVEATPRLKAALEPLRAIYPYGVDCVAQDPSCEIMLLSKHPLRQPYAGRIEGRYPYVAEAEIAWAGRPVTVVMTHLSWPFLLPGDPTRAATSLDPAPPEFPDVPRLTQSLQAANLARHVNALPKALVVMGDFNSASWSAMQQAFRSETRLENRGHYRPSWPSWIWPIFRLPIDHVFVRGGPRVADLRLGPAVGSDHLPIEAEIAVGP